MNLNDTLPAFFLGIADHIDSSDDPFPFGPVDIYRLSQHRVQIVYPVGPPSYVWIVFVETNFFNRNDVTKWVLRVADSDDVEIGRIKCERVETAGEDKRTIPEDSENEFMTAKGSPFTMIAFKLDSIVTHPGIYTVQSILDGKTEPIGAVEFHYSKAPTLTPDQIKAIEADPNSAVAIRMNLSCKKCPTKLRVYTGIDRSPALEDDGWIWQTELPVRFICECGRTDYSLEYLKESMHGMLLKGYSTEHSSLSYVRRYGHSKVEKIVNDYLQLLDNERLEGPVQSYIEEHPILLARFHAVRLFPKPDIVGRFKADFAIVDSRRQLWLIELEKPSTKLFKRDRHPTQALMHAYGQVTDWLEQYSKYPGAVLDALGLKPNDVMGVRGAVIAGRSRDVSHEVLQRHVANPPYPNVEFMTCDDLGTALVEMSKYLA